MRHACGCLLLLPVVPLCIWVFPLLSLPQGAELVIQEAVLVVLAVGALWYGVRLGYTPAQAAAAPGPARTVDRVLIWPVALAVLVGIVLIARHPPHLLFF